MTHIPTAEEVGFGSAEKIKKRVLTSQAALSSFQGDAGERRQMMLVLGWCGPTQAEDMLDSAFRCKSDQVTSIVVTKRRGETLSIFVVPYCCVIKLLRHQASGISPYG